ncbi:RhoGAP-domain-containing protein [Neocallimastix californiae]|uniref:RhoGAP-domain-containing protein n=1 Tax=Neocallimastix californiae TaxID=1754190 RepID=A0A1Y1Y199_9FUNG|nr:RhoGAP-domain-containing protein [Neocallimastix californiae]|eukprot:ORX91791.1 RhoGAP-domain-containing protein [Neocallimastix californiae]
MILDKGHSSPTINHGPLSAPPSVDLYNKEIKDDYKMEYIGIDYNKNKNAHEKTPKLTEEKDKLNSPTSAKPTTKKEKAKKGWYQIALSKLPTKSLNSHSKKNNLFSEFKNGDASTEILIKRSPTCSSRTSIRRRVVNSNRASVCTNGTNNSVSTQASIPYASHFDSLPEVPAILKKCIALIEECGLETEGLYRISGNSSNVQNLLKLFQHEPDKIELFPPSNESSKSSSRKTFKSSSNIPPPSSSLYKDSKYLYDNDIHVVTGCIKSWLRNGIPPKNEPLWPYHLYDDLIQASQIKDYTLKMIKFQDLVHALPPLNFTALNFLFEHLFKVSTFSEQNKMTISNLAIIFGPTLLRSPPNSSENEMMIITRMPFQCKAVEILIDQYEWLFGPIEYEEESIDEEDLGKELINSSLNEIQNQLQGEIKDNEVVILKNISNNDIDVVVSTIDKMGNTIHNKLEVNKIKYTGDNNTNNKETKNINASELSKNYENTFNMVYKVTEDNINNSEEPIESIPRNVDNSDFELSFIEQGNKYHERNYHDINAESEGKEQEYQKLINVESVQMMKKENKDKSKIKIKNSTSSNKLKQLLSRPNKSKKMEDDFNLSTSLPNYSDIKSLISNPVSFQHNTEKNNKFILNNVNKNQESLSFNKNGENVNLMSTTTNDNKNEIHMTISDNSIYRILNENNNNNQIFNEPNETENEFTEKTSLSKNTNTDINQSKEIRKDKESLQRISNSSMGIFQEQFLMDGFENDIASSLNAKWNLELEKHLEQIYKDKKRSKLFINDDLENIEEKIKNINSQTSLSK